MNKVNSRRRLRVQFYRVCAVVTLLGVLYQIGATTESFEQLMIQVKSQSQTNGSTPLGIVNSSTGISSKSHAANISKDSNSHGHSRASRSIKVLVGYNGKPASDETRNSTFPPPTKLVLPTFPPSVGTTKSESRVQLKNNLSLQHTQVDSTMTIMVVANDTAAVVRIGGNVGENKETAAEEMRNIPSNQSATTTPSTAFMKNVSRVKLAQHLSHDDTWENRTIINNNRSNNHSNMVTPPAIEKVVRNSNTTTALGRMNNMTLPPTLQPTTPPTVAISQDEIIITDPSYPLFFKDGLQKTCSKKHYQYPTTKKIPQRPSNHTFKCLTVSADGNSAVFTTTLTSSSLSTLVENGDAVLFGAGIGEQIWNTTWFSGRLMNRIIELSKALSYSATCGKLIILPIAISLDLDGQGEFDCADFRRMGRPENTSGAIDEVHRQQEAEVKSAGSCSLVVSSENKWYTYSPPYNLRLLPDFENRRQAAIRTMWAWWGLGPGYFRCRVCTENDRKQTLAWARSGDIFMAENPHPKYGQPPVDYYVKSIQLSGAKHILLLSQNGNRNTTGGYLTNPIVTELPKYDFGGGNETGAGGSIHVISVLGEPFHKVLHQLFCAKVAIVGKSTLSHSLSFSPNVETLFLPKQPSKEGPAMKYGTTDVYYYDVGMNNYSVYQYWSNSAEQRREMLTFQGGTIKSHILRNRTSGN